MLSTPGLEVSCIVEELRNAGRIGSGLDILEKDKLSYMNKLFISKDRTVLMQLNHLPSKHSEHKLQTLEVGTENSR
jgi:hypothetical protein